MHSATLMGISLAAVSPAIFAADSDPASLDNLADIVTLPPVSWWPLAFAWYIVIGAVLVSLGAIAYAMWRRRQNNAYRVAALAELEHIEQNPTAAIRIAEILKRTVLATAPRKNVAALSGKRWIQWLNQTGNGVVFSKRSQQILSKHIYGAGQPDEEEIEALAKTARSWIEKHQTDIAAMSYDLTRVK